MENNSSFNDYALEQKIGHNDSLPQSCLFNRMDKTGYPEAQRKERRLFVPWFDD